jgi:hypothetical protein
VAVVTSRVVEALTSIAGSFPGKERVCSRVGSHERACCVGALTSCTSRVPRWDMTFAILCRVILLSILGDKAGKSGDLTGACSPITLPVTVRLGGSIADALNSLSPVPATGGGGRFCARGPLIRSSYSRIRRSLVIELLSIRRTLFPCSRPRSTPGSGDYVFMSAGASIGL